MRILVLGGTVFLGRHVVACALERGHHVTILHRGTHPSPFGADVEELLADRDGGLAVLGGRRFDGVVDTSGYVPRIVDASAAWAASAAQRYLFVSSVSAYAQLVPPVTEDAPLAPLVDGEEVTGETYGGLKAACESAVVARLGEDRSTIVRPGLIVGPHDPTDRFTYWPVRVADGGRVLAPAQVGQVQVIDVRDLAAWMVRLLEGGTAGAFNAVGAGVPMSEVLETCRTVTGADLELVWADDAVLLEGGVGPWIELPLWVPADSDTAGVFSVDNARAVAAGLSFRPLAETVADTLAWFRSQGRPLSDACLSRQREAHVLASCTGSSG